MSSKKILQGEVPKQAIQALKKEIFGEMQNQHIKTGTQLLKRVHTGTYLARYYPERIDNYARKVGLEEFTVKGKKRRARNTISFHTETTLFNVPARTVMEQQKHGCTNAAFAPPRPFRFVSFRFVGTCI